jgi:hypothetical protein
MKTILFSAIILFTFNQGLSQESSYLKKRLLIEEVKTFPNLLSDGGNLHEIQDQDLMNTFASASVSKLEKITEKTATIRKKRTKKTTKLKTL